MPARRDYYTVLGVKKSATADDIRSAHRRLARKLHPDVNKAPDAAEKFREVQEAYDVLSDDEKRKIYDRVGHDAFVSGVRAAHAGARGGQPGGGSRAYSWSAGDGMGAGGFSADDLGSIFEEMFSGRGGGFGGFGASPEPGARAPGGAGPFGASARRRSRQRKGADLTHDVTVPFDQAMAGGVHRLGVSRGGVSQTIEVKVPKGVKDGARLRIRGSGQPSPTGGPPGDLILTVRIGPHPLYKRDGLDIILDLPVTIAEAALGADVEVPTPRGRVTLKVPPGAASGARLRVREHGVEDDKGAKGDLYAVVKVIPPKTLTDDQRSALETLAKSLPQVRTDPHWR